MYYCRGRSRSCTGIRTPRREKNNKKYYTQMSTYPNSKGAPKTGLDLRGDSSIVLGADGSHDDTPSAGNVSPPCKRKVSFSIFKNRKKIDGRTITKILIINGYRRVRRHAMNQLKPRPSCACFDSGRYLLRSLAFVHLTVEAMFYHTPQTPAFALPFVRAQHDHPEPSTSLWLRR